MAIDPKQARLAALAEEALQRRLQWVSIGWQPSPAVVSKSDVLAYLKAGHAEHPSLPSNVIALRARAAAVSELLAGLHRDDPDLPVLALETAWPVAALPDREPARMPVATTGDRDTIPPFMLRIRLPEAADFVDKIRLFCRTFTVKDWRAIYGSLPDEDAEEYADEEEGVAGNGDRDGGGGSGGGAAAQSPCTAATNNALNGASERRPPAVELRKFLAEMEVMMRGHALWRGEVGTQKWEEALEALEKFVCAKVYSSVFSAHPRAALRDVSLERRLNSLAFVTWRHLDLADPPDFLSPGWSMAADALSAIDKFEAPSDKMACILNACRIISTLLALAADARGARDGGVGADEFLPALIYVVLHAQPPRLYSNLRYIGEFCHPNRLNSESGYFYTNVLSAVAFARNVKATHLSLSPGEFDSCMRTALDSAERRVGRHRASLTAAHGLRTVMLSPMASQGGAGDTSDDAQPAAAVTGEAGADEALLAASRDALLALRRVLAPDAPPSDRFRPHLQSHLPQLLSAGRMEPRGGPRRPPLEPASPHGSSSVEEMASCVLEAYHKASAELVEVLSSLVPSRT